MIAKETCHHASCYRAYALPTNKKPPTQPLTYNKYEGFHKVSSMEAFEWSIWQPCREEIQNSSGLDLPETKKNLKGTIKVKPHMFTFVRGVKYMLFTNDDLVINHCESLKKSRNWKVMDAKKKIVNDGAKVPRYEIIDSKIQ